MTNDHDPILDLPPAKTGNPLGRIVGWTILALALILLFLFFSARSGSPTPSPSPTPTPTPSFEDRLREAAASLADEKIEELQYTDGYRTESEEVARLQAQLKVHQDKQQWYHDQAENSRNKQQSILDLMDLLRQRQLPKQSPSPSPSENPLPIPQME